MDIKLTLVEYLLLVIFSINLKSYLAVVHSEKH